VASRFRAATALPRAAFGFQDASSIFTSDLVANSEHFVVSCVGWTVVLVSLAIIRVAVSEEKKNTPRTFLQNANVWKEPTQASRIVCVGDSLTRGNLSADWVSQLRTSLTQRYGEPLTVLNAGVNMECAPNIRRRLDEIIACRPSHVSVLVGTNDLKAGLSSIEGFMYRVFGQLPEAPTLESYEQDLVEIRERLTSAGACVALVSPPVLGEDVNSEANRRAAAFAEVVRRVAAEGGERCAYIPLFERTSAVLPENGGKSYNGFHFFALLCTLCVDVHIRQRGLDELQRERELGVTVDLVHLGPSAASQLVEMVAEFVEQIQPPELLPTPSPSLVAAPASAAVITVH